MISLSTHVLDTGTGRPLAGVAVALERKVDGGWQHVGDGVTDGDGRIQTLGVALAGGIHRLIFATGDAGSPFYPEVHLIVDLDESEQHYHVPLLLSPFGFTTYRGS
ncbi:MAG TPA: hydroxyisourate hydrolase [Acidimicrobiia bacterium]|jgi:5-hydroxyisourate hydrolase